MAVMKVSLTVVEGTEKGKSFSFDEPENFLLGRNAEGNNAYLRLSPDDTYVSLNHFLIEINPTIVSSVMLDYFQAGFLCRHQHGG